MPTLCPLICRRHWGTSAKCGPEAGTGSGLQQVRSHPAHRGGNVHYSHSVVWKTQICGSEVFGPPKGPFQYQRHVDNEHSDDKRAMERHSDFFNCICIWEGPLAAAGLQMCNHSIPLRGMPTHRPNLHEGLLPDPRDYR